MKYGIFKYDGTLCGRSIKSRVLVGNSIWPMRTFRTKKAAESAWYDERMGNGNQMIILPANTPENSYYPPFKQFPAPTPHHNQASLERATA